MSKIVEEIKDLFNEIFETQIENGVDPDVASKTCSYVMHSYFSEKRKENKETKEEQKRIEYADIIERFIDEKLIIDKNLRIKRNDMYNLFLFFLEKNNINAYFSRNELYKRLRNSGVCEFSSNKNRFFMAGVK